MVGLFQVSAPSNLICCQVFHSKKTVTFHCWAKVRGKSVPHISSELIQALSEEQIIVLLSKKFCTGAVFTLLVRHSRRIKAQNEQNAYNPAGRRKTNLGKKGSCDNLHLLILVWNTHATALWDKLRKIDTPDEISLENSSHFSSGLSEEL